jgi:hypothetical protein
MGCAPDLGSPSKGETKQMTTIADMIDDLIGGLPPELRDNAKAQLVQQLFKTSPVLREKSKRASAYQRRIMSDIGEELGKGTSVGGVIYGLLFNLLLMAYLAEGGSRGKARDQIDGLLDDGLDAIETAIGTLPEDIRKSVDKKEIETVLVTEQVRALFG